MRLLHNPASAGAYVYGQKEDDSFDRSPATGKAKTTTRPLADWPVCVRDAYHASITWDQFLHNQQMLRDNWFRAGTRGAPRRGLALLQGIARCGRCGARMSVFHYATKEKRAPGYGCVAGYVDGGATCQMMSSAPVDAAVAELFLTAVTPAHVDVALRALDAYEAERAEARRQRQMQIQQAEYEVELARQRPRSSGSGSCCRCMIADFRGGATCLNDTQLSWLPRMADSLRAGLRIGVVKGTRVEPIAPPATVRPASVASVRLPSTAGCAPVCSGGRRSPSP